MVRTHSTFDLDARIRKIANPQLGLLTVGQARTAGVDKDALSRRLDAGALAAVFRGVFRVTTVPTTPRQLALAGALAVPNSVLSAASAAVVHDLPLPARAFTAT